MRRLSKVGGLLVALQMASSRIIPDTRNKDGWWSGGAHTDAAKDGCGYKVP